MSNVMFLEKPTTESVAANAFVTALQIPLHFVLTLRSSVPAHCPSVVVMPKQPPASFNRRSEAARHRWQDPAFREKMRTARGASVLVAPRHSSRRRRLDSLTTERGPAKRSDNAPAPSLDTLPRAPRADPSGNPPCDFTSIISSCPDTAEGNRLTAEYKTSREEGGDALESGVLCIGVGDSITTCYGYKAAAINQYVRRNRLRSEKLIMFHRDKQRWMDAKLQEGEDRRLLINNEQVKRQRQLERQAEARLRHARVRAKKATERNS